MDLDDICLYYNKEEDYVILNIPIKVNKEALISLCVKALQAMETAD